MAYLLPLRFGHMDDGLEPTVHFAEGVAQVVKSLSSRSWSVPQSFLCVDFLFFAEDFHRELRAKSGHEPDSSEIRGRFSVKYALHRR